METTCQPSYPLNSENARPFGTFNAYLSCAEKLRPPKTASDTATTTIGTAIVSLRFIASTSFVSFIPKLEVKAGSQNPEFMAADTPFPMRSLYTASCATEPEQT